MKSRIFVPHEELRRALARGRPRRGVDVEVDSFPSRSDSWLALSRGALVSTRACSKRA